jgi:hypothetical protein
MSVDILLQRPNQSHAGIELQFNIPLPRARLRITPVIAHCEKQALRYVAHTLDYGFTPNLLIAKTTIQRLSCVGSHAPQPG